MVVEFWFWVRCRIDVDIVFVNGEEGWMCQWEVKLYGKSLGPDLYIELLHA